MLPIVLVVQYKTYHIMYESNGPDPFPSHPRPLQLWVLF